MVLLVSKRLRTTPPLVQGLMASEYLIAGLIFVAGSVAFLPQFGRDGSQVGAILFIVGSAMYLQVCVSEALEILHTHVKGHVLQLEVTKLCVAASYALGSLLFIVGSVYYLPAVSQSTANAINTGSAIYVAGSVVFLFGSLCNVAEINIQREGDIPFFDPRKYKPRFEKWVLNQLEYVHARNFLNWTVLYFCFGSVLFIVGSALSMPAVQNSFVASILFIVGSLLFALGGLQNLTAFTFKVTTYNSVCYQHTDSTTMHDTRFQLKDEHE